MKVYRISNNDVARRLEDAWYVVAATPDCALTILLELLEPQTLPRAQLERSRSGWLVQELGDAIL